MSPSTPNRLFSNKVSGLEVDHRPPPAATAVLLTVGDGRADWLRAGQALHRLPAHAGSKWVFASLHSSQRFMGVAVGTAVVSVLGHKWSQLIGPRHPRRAVSDPNSGPALRRT